MLWKTMFVSSVFLFWCLLCQQWYVCGIKQSCKTAEKTSPPTPHHSKVEKNVPPPLLFRWAQEQPVIDESFHRLKDSMLGQLAGNETLEITGSYFKEEKGSDDDLGLRRADEVKTLFLDKISADRINIKSEVLQEVAGVRENLFESIVFQIKDFPISTETKIVSPQESVVKTKDGVLLYFPFNATKNEANLEVDSYLQQLAVRLKKTNEKVHLIGHTDNVGDAKANYDVGRQRAKAIRKILIERGVSNERITVFSKGETEPLDSNETEIGRQKNRRIEIKILK